MFQPNSTFAPTLPVAALLWLIAYATYHRMRIRGIDFERAFLRHNDMDHPSFQNKRDLCVWLSPWESSTPHGMWAKVAKLTQGTRDAGNLFANISDEMMLQYFGAFRSGALGMSQIFLKRVGPPDAEVGLCLAGKNVDDVIVATTDNAAGEALWAEFKATFDDKKWAYTQQEVGSADGKPFDIHSLVITPTANGNGVRGNLLTQPAQLQRIEEAFDLGVVLDKDLPETMLPPGWSPVASAADPEKVSGKDFLGKCGVLWWFGITAKHSAAISLMQSQGGVSAGPSRLDMDALHWLAGYLVRVGREGAGLFFAEGPAGASVNDPPPLYCFADAGLPGHVNGAAQHGRAIFMGVIGDEGGSFHPKSNKNVGRRADSVPAEEAEAALAAAKDCIAFQELGMEAAGWKTRADYGHPSYPAPRIYVGDDLSGMVQAEQAEDDVLVARARELSGLVRPPLVVVMYEDSQTVVNAVQARNMIKGITKMRHCAITMGVLADWDLRQLIGMRKCPQEEQRADALTRVERGPIDTTRQAIALCGFQPALQARLERQLKRYTRAKPSSPLVCGGQAMVPVDFVAAAAGHSRRQHRQQQPQQQQPQQQQEQQQQEQQRPWAAWATWQDVYPRLEHPANAAERRTLSILTTLRLFPGVGLGAREQGMLLPLDGRVLAAQGKRRGIGFEVQSASRWPREGAWQPATDLSAVQPMEVLADGGAMAVDEPSAPRFAAAGTATRLTKGQLQQRLVVYQASYRERPEQRAWMEAADNEEELARLLVANTLANRSAVVGDSSMTCCEQLEQAIRASAVLDWVLGSARDAAELIYMRETQDAALRDRAERQRGEAMVAEQRDSGTEEQLQRSDLVGQGVRGSSGTAMDTGEDTTAAAEELGAEQRVAGEVAERTGRREPETACVGAVRSSEESNQKMRSHTAAVVGGIQSLRARGLRSKRSQQARYERNQSRIHAKWG